MAKKSTTPSAKVVKKAPPRRASSKPVLLSGGNPQIAKADGDAPVQAYIAAMPGWKRDVGRRLENGTDSEAVMADIRQAHEIGINGVPTFILAQFAPWPENRTVLVVQSDAQNEVTALRQWCVH